MENKGRSGAEKATFESIIHISEDLFESSLFSIPKSLADSNGDKNNSRYTLFKNGNNFQLADNASLQLNYILNVPATQSNFDFIISFINSQNTTPKKSADKTLTLKKQSKSFSRRLLSQVKKREINSQSLHDLMGDIATLTNENREVQYLYSNFDTIAHLPELILSTDQFKSFSTCQFLVHEKGNLYCESFVFRDGTESNNSNVPVESFNSIYNLIKKSKSKQFNQSQILKEDIQILGTFLAKSFDFKNHTIILILSRNDFLPPSPEENSAFEQYCLKLKPLLSYILERAQIAKKSQSINLALLNYTEPIAILTARDQILFQNKLFTEEHYYEYLSGSEKYQTFPLNKEHTLVTQIVENAKVTSDITHFQRISLLGELLNTLRHELSNPLFGLKLSSDMLAMEAEDQDSKETLLDISNSSDRCQTIIKNFSFLYSEEEVKDLVNISKVLDETVILTKSESRQIKKDIKFVNFQEEDYLVSLNPTWLSQIIFNMIINSSQAIKTINDDLKNHLIEISVENLQDEIVFTVSDTGPGVPQELKDKLFDPFFTTKSSGTGLGLSICKNLAHKLGGKLKLVDPKNFKTAFQLSIPKEATP